MYVIGVAGHSGSGKTEFADVLLTLNFNIFALHMDEMSLAFTKST